MSPTVSTGEGNAAAFVGSAEDAFRDALGFRPFHGTLNLQGTNGVPELEGWLPWNAGDHCDGVAYDPCYVSGVRAAVIRPAVPGYPDGKSEVLAPVRLRDLFDVADGVSVALADRPWTPAGRTTAPGALDAFDAVVFDFDGTLAEFAVDWATVHEDLAELLDPHLARPLAEYERQDVFDVARRAGVYDDVESILTAAEAGAVADSPARSELAHVDALDCPLGICTANAAAPVRAILDRHGAGGAFETIVARDTMPAGKPDPRPLLRCLDELGVDPGNALFVGNERTDAEAAHRAGTSFLHPTQLRTDG